MVVFNVGVHYIWSGTLALFTKKNYTTPYTDLCGLCTFCAENNLVPYKISWIFDHVLIRGMKAEQAKVKHMYLEELLGRGGIEIVLL